MQSRQLYNTCMYHANLNFEEERVFFTFLIKLKVFLYTFLNSYFTSIVIHPPPPYFFNDNYYDILI